MKQFIRSDTSPNMRWSDTWRPYSGATSTFQTLYVDGVEVGYVESYDLDGDWGYIAYLKASPTEYEESLGTFRSAAQARNRLEQEVMRAQNLIDTFPVDSSASVKASTDGTWYNVSWYSQCGSQNGECVFVPDYESYDPYSYIEHYLANTYGDEYGGIADYIETDVEDNYSIWDEGYQPITSTTSEEAQLDQAILDSKPFDLDVFTKYKVDPYRAKGAVQAKNIKAGDFIVVTEDASEVDTGTVLEVFDVRYDDPDNYNFSTTLDDDKVITFICKDKRGRKLPYNLHFWPNDYVGPIIGHQAVLDPDDFVQSASEIRRYSDVRPYKDRRYWYFTTHGVGPGTIPNDLNVLEVREGQNDKGTWGDFVCLDGVLNTDELNYYDLKELAPDSITSASEIDDEDEWSPYHGHNYMVTAGPYNELTFHCDDPKSAITHWFKYQKKYPTDVSIMCPTKELAIELVKAGTPKLLNELYDRSGCPYKIDWMIAECAKKVSDGCRGFYEGEYGYGDSVYPFCVG